MRRAQAWIALVAAAPLALAAEDRRETTVGVAGRIDQLVLPGSELEVAPIALADEVVLRIVAVWPHGTDFRYDLEYQGLVPGEHDLTRYLVRKDGSPSADLPPIPVTVRSVLPEGRVRPGAPRAGETPSLGGYRATWIAGGIAWVAGLVLILRAGRRKPAGAEVEVRRPRTLAERLHPLVERALAGELSTAERARLELALVALWRKRLGLEQRPPDEALAELRAHAEAGPLLVALEEWLHRPEPREPVDVARLLAPYREIDAAALAELDAPAAAATRGS